MTSGSSALSGTKTVPLPPLVILSRPWSKNWPKMVNSELNGGESPTSVVTLGMSRVRVRRDAAGGQAVGAAGRAGLGGAGHDALVALRSGRGSLAAATAAGFVEVWSTIRLLIVRGSESNTLPLVCA